MPSKADDLDCFFQSLESRAVRDADGRITRYDVEPNEEARSKFMRQLITLTGGDVEEYDLNEKWRRENLPQRHEELKCLLSHSAGGTTHSPLSGSQTPAGIGKCSA